MKLVRWSIFIAIAAILFLGIYLACSRNSEVATAPQNLSDTAGLISAREGGGKGYTGLWGYYSVAVFPADRKVEMTPMRTAGMTINVLPFMHGPEGEMACLTIEILEYKDLGITGDCLIGVNLKHPYPNLPEFCGFDVMGLFITDGSGEGVQDPSLKYPIQGKDPVLVNADGYTRWMNPTEFPDDAPFGYVDPMSEENSGFIANATVNGYKYFADGLGPEEPVEEYFSDPATCAKRGLFPNGGECTRNYQIQFPLKGSIPQIFFNYAVVASWAEPLPSPPEHIPIDFPREANAQFPIYAAVTDYSTLYYTDSDAGGDIILDVELFDWINLWEPDSLKNRITRVVLESADGLIEGDHWEMANPKVVMFKGEAQISSHLVINVPGNPSADGFEDLFLAVEVESESGYYQGFGEAVPAGPLALYLKPRVEIGTCPDAVIISMSETKVSSGEQLNGVEISGTGFIDGPDLSVRLENSATGETVQGDNTEFVSTKRIKTDFNLAGVAPGVFDVVCTNGCGTESSPPDDLPNWDGKVQIVSEIPKDVTLSTQRTGPSAAVVNSLHISWSPAEYAQSYRIYVDKDPYSATAINGMLDGMEFLVETTATTYIHSASSPIPFNNHSNYTYIVKSFSDIGSGSGESQYSNVVLYCGQDFALFNPANGTGLNCWGYCMEYGNPLQGYISKNGYSGYGFSFDKDLKLTYSVWLIIHTPLITSIPGTTKAYLEFNHRHESFKPPNGYFAGYIHNGLPSPTNSTVIGAVPINAAAYGAAYCDTSSPAIQYEFNWPTYSINNFQKTDSGWWGWYFSGFDLSEAVTSGGDYRAIIGMAFSEGGVHRFELDDCALLVY